MVALIGGLASAACSHAPQQVQAAEEHAAADTAAMAAETAAETTSSPSAAEPAPTVPTPTTTPTAEPAASRPGVIVVDPGSEVEDNRSKGLVDAARAERERRAHAGRPVVVINDKTLPHLPKGQLTYAEPKPAKAEGESPAAPAGAGSAHGEAYWRDRAREIRTRWRAALDDIEKQQQTAADLRRRFYAEDDPYRRDTEIKPEWDRALDRLARQREEAVAAERELAEFLEEGRRGGALPGWLREGAELEPPPSPQKPGLGAAIEPPEGGQAIEPPELGESPP